MGEILFRNLVVEEAEQHDGALWSHVEDAMCGAVPASFKSFWAATSAWTLQYSIFLPGERDGRPYAFYLERPEKLIDEARSLSEAWFRDQLPEKVLPIGRTGAEDDTLMIDLGDPRGRILAWISARPKWRGGPETNALHVVALDFYEYLQRLVLLKQDVADELQDPALASVLESCCVADVIRTSTVDWGEVLRPKSIDD